MTDDTIDDLKNHIEYIDDKYDARIAETITPRIEELESDRDKARQQRDQLFDAVEVLEQEVAVLRERIEGMTGLAADESSSPDKRLFDLRQSMIRRAEAREERGEKPGIKMHYKDIQELFADLGHGEVKKPLCYKAMRDARDAPGFKEATKYKDGLQIEATLLNLEELRSLVGSNDITTADEVVPDDMNEGVVNITTEQD